MLRRMKIHFNSFFIFAFATLLIGTIESQSEIVMLENGDQVSFAGSYYDFRDSSGVQMVKMWIPPNTTLIKGMFISGHGGGSGDSRNFARDENIRAFAMRLGFAVAGLHNFPGRRVYEQGAPKFFHALEEFSKLGEHPEIANLPFVMYGSSNGGATTYGFVNYAPERAICFVSNVASGGQPDIPVDAALKVPGIFILGKFDALIRERGINRTKELFEYARPKGALWSWALELKGHEDGASFDIYMKLVEQAVKARYPKNGDPSKGPIKLLQLDEQSGWLVDLSSWDKGITKVAPYDDYQGDKSHAGWVMNKDMAYVYRSLATFHNPLSLKVKEFDRTFNPHTDPGTMFSLGGPVASPGEEITIMCETEEFPKWKALEFFNGAQELGIVKKGEEPQIRTRLKAENLVYCLTVLATNDLNRQRTCAPMHFFVKDHALDWSDVHEEKIFSGVKTGAGSKNLDKTINCTSPDKSDSILVAYGLTAELERLFSAHDGKVSHFWNLIDENKDYIELTARANAKEGAQFNFVLTHDCNMIVKAAYGADGIYLLFEINDDNDVFWPNKYAGTENEQFYLNFDAVDFLIDTRSVQDICNPQNIDMFMSKGFGLTFTTRQYQAACGTPKEKTLGFLRALADPWDFHATYFTYEDARRIFGLEVENFKTDYFYKAQEWFIPWSELGGGLPEEPEAGTRMGFAAGFNDRDEGEHFPPGVTSSGGSVHASNSIRWIGKMDPWSSGPRGGSPPYAWGEIELGEMLK